MFGVILWRDLTAQKAVIWCEDQGPLAYSVGHPQDAAMLEVGDMVRFELAEVAGLRRATGIAVIGADMYRDLPESLRRAVAEGALERIDTRPFLRLVGAQDTDAILAAEEASHADTDLEDDADDEFADEDRTYAGEIMDTTNVVPFRFITKKRHAG